MHVSFPKKVLKVVHVAPTSRDDYPSGHDILTDCEGGNPVSALGVGGS